MREEQKNKILEYSLLSFGLFPILPDRIKGLPVILLLFFSMLFFFRKRKTNLNWKRFLVLSSLYFCWAYSLLYTENIERGIKVLTETRVTVLLIPLAFMFLHSNNDVLTSGLWNRFKRVFAFSTLAFSILYVLYIPLMPTDPDPFFQFPSVFFFRNCIEHLPIIGMEPIYAALCLGIAIIFIVSEYLDTKKLSLLNVSMFLIFLGILIVISSKMTLLALAIILGFVMVMTIKSKKQKTILIMASVLGMIALFNVPTIKQRSSEFFQKETYTEYKRHNSTSIRLTVLRCAFEVSGKNWLLGVGVGDVKNELVECYEDISYDLVERRYNSHNQYVSVLLATGIIGFLIFLIFWAYNIKWAFQSKDLSYSLILIFFGLQLASENLLERQNGVLLFYYLICFLSFLYYSEKKRKI